MSWAAPEGVDGSNVPEAQGNTIFGPAALIQFAYQATNPIDVFGYRTVDFVVRITNLGNGPMTRLDMQFQFSEKSNPNPLVDSDWATVQSQQISLGVATLSDYTLQKALPGVAPVTVGVGIPVRARFMRMKLQSGNGDATNSVVLVNALRR
jgi:hypothetical protein